MGALNPYFLDNLAAVGIEGRHQLEDGLVPEASRYAAEVLRNDDSRGNPKNNGFPSWELSF